MSPEMTKKVILEKPFYKIFEYEKKLTSNRYAKRSAQRLGQYDYKKQAIVTPFKANHIVDENSAQIQTKT
jgi:hypothetical protein